MQALPEATPEAVFLDRDGVINENRPDHVKSWEEFRFLPGTLNALARLFGAGLRTFVISNQAVINQGIVPRARVDELNEQMIREVERFGGHVNEVAYCPHTAAEGCECRKPRPGLLTSLAGRHGVNLTRSVIVGDAMSDVEAGLAAGCRVVLVLTGRGRDQLLQATTKHLSGPGGLIVRRDLSAAVDWVLAQRKLRLET
jgi:D-glycero-D-manno-heptose 1,7-bisphosphate phosphatase